MAKKKTNAQLKKKLWQIFALYIKERDRRICFTCGKQVEGFNCHAGHFIPKAAGGITLYFHEDNVHVQCASCNLFLAGNQYVYGQKLGKKKVAELYRIKNEIVRYYPFEEKILYYTQKVNEILSSNQRQENSSGKRIPLTPPSIETRREKSYRNSRESPE